MKLVIDGQEYELSPEAEKKLLGDLWVKLIDGYREKLSPPERIGLMAFVRTWILPKLERTHGKAIRPPRGADPCLHLAGIFFNAVKEVMQHAAIVVATRPDDDTTVAAFGLSVAREGESWRQMVSAGDDRQRKNDLRQAPAGAAREALSNEPGVHP